MTPKNRNAMLILVCALLIFALPMLQPDVVVPPFAWDWRTSPGTGPIEDAPSHDPTAIRVLAAPDAPWVQELLRSVGVIGVHTGAPSSANPDEVWILTGAGCAHAEAATAHAQAGGALLVLARCDGLLAALEVPPPCPGPNPPRSPPRPAPAPAPSAPSPWRTTASSGPCRSPAPTSSFAA